MRISVYLKEQDYLQDSAPHEVSRNMAAACVARQIALPVGQNAIQFIRDITLQEAKAMVRGTRITYTTTTNGETTTGIWSLLPPLDWYYPWTDLPQWLIRTYRQHKLAA